MLWLLLTLSTAVYVALQEVCMKKFFSHKDKFEMSAFPMAFGFPFFAITMPFVSVPDFDFVFVCVFLLSIPVNLLGFALYMYAIKISPISLTVPYLAFSPAFLILTGYVILGELPQQFGIIGILITCLGAYIINIDPGRWSFLQPLKAIVKERGSWVMLIVSFIFSVAAPLGKKAILHSSVMFFSISLFFCLSFLWITLLSVFGKIKLSKVLKDGFPKGIIVGALLYVEVMTHGWAISMVKAAYMLSVKRLSIVISVTLSKFIFKESNVILHLSGTILMLVGTIIIIIQTQ